MRRRYFMDDEVKRRIEELEKKIDELKEALSKLEKEKVVVQEYHYHYHYYQTPYQPPYWPIVYKYEVPVTTAIAK